MDEILGSKVASATDFENCPIGALYILAYSQILRFGSIYWFVVSNFTNNASFKEAFDKDLLMEILDTSGTPLFVKNQQYQIILLNKALADLVGMDRSEMVGKTDFDLYSPVEAAAFLEADERVFRTRTPVQYEEVITDSNNVSKALRTTKDVIENLVGRTSFSRDRTRHYRTQCGSDSVGRCCEPSFFDCSHGHANGTVESTQV